MTSGNWLLLKEFVRRDLVNRYLGTVSGAIWALAQPLLQLAIYGYVFQYIFRARLPEAEFGDLDFLAFLAIGLWPWNAFSEALNRATNALPENAGLIGKVAVPQSILVAAPVVAAFLVNGFGFLVILVVLWLGGWITPQWQALLCVPWFVLLLLFALGWGWLCAALNVIVRDISQAMPQVLMLVFFITPILYPQSLIPEGLKLLADLNPLAHFIGLFRYAIVGAGEFPWEMLLVALSTTAMMFLLGRLFFQRLAQHFEDFL